MNYIDRDIVCVDCGETFVFTASEQEFHASKGFDNDPKRCKPCRKARRPAADEKAAVPAAADDRPEVAAVAAAEDRAEIVRCSTPSVPLVARIPKCRSVRAATVMSSAQTASAASVAEVAAAVDAATAGSRRPSDQVRKSKNGSKDSEEGHLSPRGRF